MVFLKAGGLGEFGGGFGGAALGLEGEGEVIMGQGKGGLKADGLVVLDEGGVGVAEAPEDTAEVDAGLGVGGEQSDEAAEAGLSLGQAAEFRKGFGPSGDGGGVIRLEAGGLSEVGQGFFGFAHSREGLGEVEVGFGVIRQEAESLGELGPGFVGVAEGEEELAEAERGGWVPRASENGGLVMGEGLVGFAKVNEGEGEVVEGVGGVGVGEESGLEMGEGEGVIALEAEFNTELGFGDGVVSGDGEGVGEEGGVVTPEAELVARGEGASGQDEQTGGGKQRFQARLAGGEAGHCPGEAEEDADEGDVGVAVGQGMAASLKETENGHQGTEEPKPADGDPGSTFELEEGNGGTGEQEESGQQDLPVRPGVQGGGNAFRVRVEIAGIGMGIEDSEARGPKGFGEVGDAGADGVINAEVEREVAHDEMALVLRGESDEGAGKGEGEEGKFFAEQKRGGRHRGETLQGPKVEEQEEGREGDEHGFAHQAEGEKEQGEKIERQGMRGEAGSDFERWGRGKDAGREAGRERSREGHATVDVLDIGPEGEEEEEGAEDVFAFGEPGDRFNVQGMDGEEGGDKGARPLGASHLAQDEEKQESIGQVEEEVVEMVPTGIQAKELDCPACGKGG